ncbi:MAG: S41 family peptidase [Acidobacteriota bacterium]
MKILTIFSLVLFVQTFTHAQFQGYTPEYPVQSTEEYTRSNIYQQDFLYYCDALLDSHPDVYSNFPKEEFSRQKQMTFEKLSGCKDSNEFLELLNRFITPLRDGHTTVPSPSFYSEKEYPVRYRFFGDSLYIINATSQVPDLSGEIVASINGLQVKDIRDKAGQCISAENSTALTNTLNSFLHNAGFMKYIGIVKNEADSITVSTLSKKSVVLYPNSNSEWQTVFRDHPVTARGSYYFDYQILKDKSLCYFQFNAFTDKEIVNYYLQRRPWWQRYLAKTARFFGLLPKGCNDYFHEFLNDMIEDMESNAVKTLVVDLRNNGGGNSMLGNELLYALGVDKYKSIGSSLKVSRLYKMQYPEAKVDAAGKSGTSADTAVAYSYLDYSEKIPKRFKGKVYYIIGEWTFSSAILHAATVEDNKFFPVIGEATMERPSHFGDLLFLRLPNTKSVCRISSKQFHRPDKTKDGDDTLYPDVPVYKTYRSIIDGTDPAYEWIIKQKEL